MTTSIFELFKIGPGPSSSHTMAPMRAGAEFLACLRVLPPAVLQAADRIEARLYGSLSATGKGHGTDGAVAAGLLGYAPETCPPDVLDGLLGAGARHPVDLAGKRFWITDRSVVFDAVEHGFPFNNTLVLCLLGGGEILVEREYYSVGGGFLRWKGQREPERREPAHPYSSMAGLRGLLDARGLSLPRLILENERALTGASEGEVLAGLDRVLEAMDESVERGLAAEGTLPGPLQVRRNAPALLARLEGVRRPEGRALARLSAYAFAAAEENAAGHRIVTAPTAGSAGVLPSVFRVMTRHLKVRQGSLREGLLAAFAVGALAKHNASIAGADVGCQGEIGVAASMAAAAVAQASGLPPAVVEAAAETAMEHHLGLTCDPVGGFVQIPCIERCAMGAVKAYNAAIIAAVKAPGGQRVTFDEVICAMAATGRDMNAKYKETSRGGLAVSIVNC